MHTPQTEQKITARFRGKTFSPEDLTNRHEAQLIKEFFQGSDKVRTAQANNTESNK